LCANLIAMKKARAAKATGAPSRIDAELQSRSRSPRCKRVNVVPKKRGRPPLLPWEIQERTAAAAAAKAKARKRGRPTIAAAKAAAQKKRAAELAAKRAKWPDAATWRASYVAERYSISMSLVYKLVKSGALPSKRVGRTTLIAAAACAAYFEGV
jgi:membrane protein involved in colicin uptake